MKNVARLSKEDRRELFLSTADKIGLNDGIVEKDFWVCYMLDYLFNRCPWKDSLTFKGGTSLSKGYNLINRFSEDIDLILDWRVLGYKKDEPWLNRSNTKQDLFNKEIKAKAEAFLKGKFCPIVKDELSIELDMDVDIHINEDDKETVIFAYPRLLSSPATLRIIRLEIGALAAWTPSNIVSIRPYVVDYYPQLFDTKETSVLTVSPERTFWEKTTILHREANRPEYLKMPQRYSRHYYDLYCMSLSPIKNSAFENIDLLKTVVDFNNKFYPRSWARYKEATVGILKLVPPNYRFQALRVDYKSMKNMIYKDVPSFENVMWGIMLLEKEINSLR